MPRGRAPKRLTPEQEAAAKDRVAEDVKSFLRGGGVIKHVPRGVGVGYEDVARGNRRGDGKRNISIDGNDPRRT